MLSQRKCINFSDINVHKPYDLKGKSFYHETQTQKKGNTAPTTSSL